MYDELLPLAREAIRALLAGQDPPSVAAHHPPQACFVSLKLGGMLRGCIGTIEPVREHLEWEVQANAVAAANRDPRFNPVTAAEFGRLAISVDVLSPPDRIGSVHELDPSRFGLIVRAGSRCGVLLPDLAGVESGVQQLEICLEKGRIRADEPYELERFTVSRIHEP